MGGERVRLRLVVIRAADVVATASFYEALGLTLAHEQHGSGPAHRAAVLADGTVFEIYPAHEDAGTRGVRLGFEVTSSEAVLDAALTWGGVVIRPPGETPWGRQAVVRDPAGHTVEISEVITNAR